MIKIGYSTNNELIYLEEPLENLRTQYPGVEVKLIQDKPAVLTRLINTSKIDVIAVYNTFFADLEDMHIQRLCCTDIAIGVSLGAFA